MADIDPRILAILAAARGAAPVAPVDPSAPAIPQTIAAPDVPAVDPSQQIPAGIAAPPVPAMPDSASVAPANPVAPLPIQTIATPAQGVIPTTTTGPVPTATTNVNPPSDGPVKRGLKSFLYGFGEAAKTHVGLPTDYQIQQNQLKTNLAQQAANDTSAYRQVQIGGLQEKADALAAQNAPYTFANDNTVHPLLRGKTMTTSAAQVLQKVLLQNDGKADAATINQGLQVPVSKEYAEAVGMPELAGQTVSGKTIATLNKMTSGLGLNHVTGDIGNGHTGIIDKANGKVLQDLGVSSRVIGASMNTNNRTVQVVDPNNPEATRYMSPAQANAMGAQGTQSLDYQTQKGLLRDFTSGSDAHTLNALNTARGHINQGLQAVKALDNGDIPLLNKVANAYGVNTGQSAPLVFNAIRNALAGEVSKSLTGSGATVSEIAQVGQDFDNAKSPSQLNDVLSTYGHILDSKRGSLRDQYQSGKSGSPNFGGSSQPAAAPSGNHPSFFHPLNP